MKRSHLYLVGAGLLLAFAGFTLTAFQETLTPYVPFSQARQMERTLQVAGELVQGSSRYEATGESLHFTLREPETGETLPVRYHGLKPANFEDAISIVAIGHWDGATADFAADKLLVKCPSKYQGIEGAEVKEYSAAPGADV